MRWVAMIAVGVALIAVPVAEGRTVIVDRPNMQGWVDAAKVPTPDLEITVSRDLSVCPVGSAGCAILSKNQIVIGRSYANDPSYFFHEVGHFFDRTLLNARDRDWFSARIFDLPDISWDTWLIEDGRLVRQADPGLQEAFATTYAFCSLGWQRTPHWLYRVGWKWPIGKACGKIKRVYWR